jgi:TolB protein
VFERRIGHATDCRLRGECDTAFVEVHVMNADGTGQQMLTGPQMLTPGGATPAWSPDGKKIAFVSRRDGNEAEIYVINPDGSGLRNLTRTPDWNETSFVWSPGQKN